MQKKILIKIIALLILVCTLLPFAAACSDKGEFDAETAVDENGEIGYEFPEGVDFEGRTYNILNCYKDQWEQICLVTSHEMDGTAINDAVYKRTVWLEESLNCTLTETNVDIYEVKKTLDVIIDSGDLTYGVAYMQVQDISAEMIQNRLTQLDHVQNMKLDESYWNKELMEVNTINNRHYSAVSDAHLMHFDGSWCVFFNKQTLEDNDLELPYDLVRSGEWTLEKMVTMSQQLANLNGDDSWDLNLQGNAHYGFTTYWVGVGTLLYGVDAQFGKKDLHDIPYLTCKTPDFTDKADDVAKFCAEPGTFYAATADNKKMEEKADALFINERVAFAGLQICFMNKFMKADVEFGIVPFPKYNEDQEEYNVSSSVTAPFLTIPYGYAYTEDIGLIMDAMSYEADRTLAKVYYEDHLELKSNTGEVLDNIEMLELIRQRRSADAMIISGVNEKFHKEMCESIKKGGGSLSSTYETYAPQVEKHLAKLRLFFGIK